MVKIVILSAIYHCVKLNQCLGMKIPHYKMFCDHQPQNTVSLTHIEETYTQKEFRLTITFCYSKITQKGITVYTRI